MRLPLGDTLPLQRWRLRKVAGIVALMAADLCDIERLHTGICDVGRHFELRRVGWSWNQIQGHDQEALRAAGLPSRVWAIGSNRVVEIEPHPAAPAPTASTTMSLT